MRDTILRAVAIAAVVLGCIAGLGAIGYGIVYSETKAAEAQSGRMASWEKGLEQGRPIRVVVTETWQMPVLAKYGYLPDEHFWWSTWSGPHGCYILPAKEKGALP